MAKTIKITKGQEQALIWAINIFEMSSQGVEDDELETEYNKALTKLAPIYEQLNG